MDGCAGACQMPSVSRVCAKGAMLGPRAMIRLLHFSDVHLPSSLARLRLRDLASKRLLGAANVLVRRRRRFRDARIKLAALSRLATELAADAVLCTGDYTELGTEDEIRDARALVEPFLRAPLGFITMPGNHDLYVPDTVQTRRFERHFGDLLRTDLPEHAVDGPWPAVRLLGETVAVVAVRSARPNPEPWRSSGMVAPAELGALARILSDPRVSGRFVIVATHYALRKRDGRHDSRLQDSLTHARAAGGRRRQYTHFNEFQRAQ